MLGRLLALLHVVVLFSPSLASILSNLDQRTIQQSSGSIALSARSRPFNSTTFNLTAASAQSTRLTASKCCRKLYFQLRANKRSQWERKRSSCIERPRCTPCKPYLRVCNFAYYNLDRIQNQLWCCAYLNRFCHRQSCQWLKSVEIRPQCWK